MSFRGVQLPPVCHTKQNGDSMRTRYKTQTDFIKASKESLRSMVHYRKTHNLPIEPELNYVMGLRFPGWDTKNQVFTGRHRRVAGKSGMHVSNQTMPKQSDTLQPQSKHDELHITVHPIRTTPQGTYSDVMVNGRKLLSNHLNTEIKVMSGGCVLAIRGIVTDDMFLPQIMQWRVFYADLQSAVPQVKQMLRNYNVHAKAVYEMPDGGVRIDLSNRSTIFPSLIKILRHAAGKKFVFDDKQR